LVAPGAIGQTPSRRANKRVQFGYGLNYLIDVEHAIIVDVEATPARTYDEVASTKTMIERTEQRLDLKPDWLAADTAYGIGKLLAWLLGYSSSALDYLFVKEPRARVAKCSYVIFGYYQLLGVDGDLFSQIIFLTNHSMHRQKCY
jgi:hypothetical protein